MMLTTPGLSVSNSTVVSCSRSTSKSTSSPSMVVGWLAPPGRPGLCLRSSAANRGGEAATVGDLADGVGAHDARDHTVELRPGLKVKAGADSPVLAWAQPTKGAQPVHGRRRLCMVGRSPDHTSARHVRCSGQVRRVRRPRRCPAGSAPTSRPAVLAPRPGPLMTAVRRLRERRTFVFRLSP